MSRPASTLKPRRVLIRRGITLSLCLALITTAAAQGVPADIAARDRALAEQLNRDRTQIMTVEQREQMQRVLNDQRQRFYYETWLEEAWNRPGEFVFLPPFPPALANPVSDQLAPPYPSALVNVVGEPFFMPFSKCYIGQLLNARQLARMERYRETRDRLVGALRAQLALIGQTPPDQQARSLAEFSAIQAAPLRKLEAEAESIRDELSYLDDGSAFMKQREALTPDEGSRLKGYYAAQRAAQFHPGLSLDQRQLLQAVAHEASDAAQPLAGLPRAFFLPATARIRWPQANPAGAAERVQEFATLRQTLVSELTESIAKLPDDMPRSRLRKHFAALAVKQGPQFQELHRLAEEIRTTLAQVPYPDHPAPTDLPAELVQEVGEAAFRRRAFQAETDRLLREFNRSFAPEQLRLVFPNQEPVIELVSGHRPAEKPRSTRAKLLSQLQECNAWLSRRHRELAAATEKSNAALTRYRETLPPAGAVSMEQLADQLAQTYVQRETWSRFGDYYRAVLLPGLAPAQRRLLFNAAHRDLEKHRLAVSD